MKFYELDAVPDGAIRYTGKDPAENTRGPLGPRCSSCAGTLAGDVESYPSLESLNSPEANQASGARDKFVQIFIQNPWLVLMRRDALEQLQAEGIRGLNGRRTDLRFRQECSPELRALEIEQHGLYHPDCMPPTDIVPCRRCGSYEPSRPEEPLLDGASLPEHLDLFRLRNGSATLVITERFADTLRRLGFEEFSLREVPVR
ncbi:SitI6 family double-CXXCG motif immunity protein [Archangium lipolyticum]|uniref:SitI6 family double-CXXCG motif immunity protein n=1 Tax=Archangium lipolyticum TaxID=2970465 RepID=UPI00214A86FA|nr:double-CXXCG motif protein [Archangium lipolyticum]